MAALAAAAVCAAAFAWVRGGEGRLAPLLRALRRVLAASLMTTEGILLAQGRWREALPLHLCSISALCALALPARGGQGRLDFLGYLGMPGALLALLFPAPAVSRWQTLLDASYYTTHALILVLPLCCLAAGKMWEQQYGLPGLVHHDRILEPGEELLAGRVGYHRREGQHFLSYHDWEAYMDFGDLHRAETCPETR